MVGGSNLKPKMIRRLAKPHEIRVSQEKEGNEAMVERRLLAIHLEQELGIEYLRYNLNITGDTRCRVSDGWQKADVLRLLQRVY